MNSRGQSGIWEGFITGICQGDRYKYHIVSKYKNYRVEKADLVAFHNETANAKASVIWGIEYAWKYQEWMRKREFHNCLQAPISIYEIHPGSWKRKLEENNRPLS